MFEFKNPAYLFLLIPLLFATIVFWYRRFNNRESAVKISSKKIVSVRKSLRGLTYPYLPVLRFLSVLLLILALARPGKGVNYSSVNNLGIDIMVVFDISYSMMGEDFRPKNRLNVAKLVVNEFIKGRKTDRIGLVAFAGEAFFQCPLTVEYPMIMQIVNELDHAERQYDGTAIGEALALAAARMESSKSKSKIILLLTDGMNNAGSIDPETAAKMCADMDIKIYSVGIGTEGTVKMPSKHPLFPNYMKSHFDEKAIKKLSDITGGKFYRAKSSGVLWKNIQDIDRLEKSKYEVKIYHEFYDKFEYVLFAAMALFLLELLLRSLVYRKVP